MGERAMKYQNPLHNYAKKLRNNSTDAERLMWRYLRNSQIEGIKFRRQQPIESYIVDFVAFDPKIVLELDGGQHAEQPESDNQRDTCLRKNGFTVLRFWNNEVFENIGGVLETIRDCCLKHAPPPPTPLPQGEGEQLYHLLHNRRGIALLYLIILFTLIGVLVSAGVKKMSASVTLGKNIDTRTALERTEISLLAWAAKNGRMPTFGQYSTAFGSMPLDAWGKPLVFAYYSSLTHTDEVCSKASTAVIYNSQYVAFILLSGGDDYVVNSPITSGALPITSLSPSSLDMFRVISLEELKNRVGCYGAR